LSPKPWYISGLVILGLFNVAWWSLNHLYLEKGFKVSVAICLRYQSTAYREESISITDDFSHDSQY
jgi:hypothetical protein